MKILKDMLHHAPNAKEPETSLREIPCLWNTIYKSIYSMCDFMGPFKNSHGYEHILDMVDYVSKWVEAMSCRKAFTEESISMIKNMIFPRFGTPRILISDGGTHFTGKVLVKVGT
jgi:hypothetical protein